MDISFEQRQLLSSLHEYGYIGNWYKSPNKTFLKVYLACEEKDIYMRVQFDIRLNVVDMVLDDPTRVFFQKSESEERFSNLIPAIREVVPHSFDNYALPIEDEKDHSFLLVIERKEIQTGDPSETLFALKGFVSTPQNIFRYKETVEILVTGYDHDSRELWEIEEVRNFVNKLDDEFPYWLFFLTKEGSALNLIIRCFLLPYLTPEADKRVNSKRLSDYLEKRGFPAMNQLCQISGMDDNELELMTKRVITYLSSNVVGKKLVP